MIDKPILFSALILGSILLAAQLGGCVTPVATPVETPVETPVKPKWKQITASHTVSVPPNFSGAYKLRTEAYKGMCRQGDLEYPVSQKPVTAYVGIYQDLDKLSAFWDDTDIDIGVVVSADFKGRLMRDRSFFLGQRTTTFIDWADHVMYRDTTLRGVFTYDGWNGVYNVELSNSADITCSFSAKFTGERVRSGTACRGLINEIES